MPTETVKTGVSSLAKKMVAAMGDIEAVTKSGKNEKQGYRYVKAADVANEVRSVLVAHGIAFFYSVDSVERWEKPTNAGGNLFFCEVRVSVILQDMDSGEERTVNGVGWGADSLEKAPYKAMTGALKYCLRMGFLIPDEEDPENEKAEPKPRAAAGPVVNQTPAKGTEVPRPGDRKPQAASVAPVAPSVPSEAPVAALDTPGERARDQKDKAKHNKTIRDLQAAVPLGKDPETHASKVKEYIIVALGPDYVKASFEKWDAVLNTMEKASAEGKLAELIGA